MSELPPAPEEVELRLKYSQGLMRLQWGRYDNGRVALQLADAETGEPIAKATVNIPEIEIAADEAFIKNWSENEGMLEALIEAGLVTQTVMAGSSNHVDAPIVRWAVALPEIPEFPEE